MKTKWVAPTLGMLALAGLASAEGNSMEYAGEAITAGMDALQVAVTKAQETADTALFTANNIWMLVATVLVFIMHLGFSTLESGLIRAKNTVNVLFKNVAIVGIGIITYTLWGFNLMYPGDDFAGGFFGFAGFWINAGADYNPIEYADGAYTYWTDFIFQAMFAATAATIVSGAVAERIKLGSFIIFSILYVGLIYPWVGMWQWGGGWLSEMGFVDFAGSTLVHSVGGWGALAGAIVLGPRLGKYLKGSIRPVLGHNLPLATVGMFLLWFGWYGFNGGSVLSGDAEGVSYVFVTTTLGAVGGLIGCIATSWTISKKPDLSMTLNGVLAGLVGITASADIITPAAATLIGLIAGVLVYFSVLFFDKIKVDDPVGAVSVHLVCGVWGTLATGIWGDGAVLSVQIIGILAYGATSFVSALVLFYVIKLLFGLRVHREEELAGLDVSEHSAESYGGFQILN
jgi:ammonium transporter, Amt family